MKYLIVRNYDHQTDTSQLNVIWRKLHLSGLGIVDLLSPIGLHSRLKSSRLFNQHLLYACLLLPQQHLKCHRKNFLVMPHHTNLMLYLWLNLLSILLSNLTLNPILIRNLMLTLLLTLLPRFKVFPMTNLPNRMLILILLLMWTIIFILLSLLTTPLRWISSLLYLSLIVSFE